MGVVKYRYWPLGKRGTALSKTRARTRGAR